jgi:hypothetical protein
MTKMSKDTLLKATTGQKETPLDKTTRIVRGMTDDADEQRRLKTARLRKARVEREAVPETK